MEQPWCSCSLEFDSHNRLSGLYLATPSHKAMANQQVGFVPSKTLYLATWNQREIVGPVYP